MDRRHKAEPLRQRSIFFAGVKALPCASYHGRFYLLLQLILSNETKLKRGAKNYCSRPSMFK